jgi:hypothetical protein
MMLDVVFVCLYCITLQARLFNNPASGVNVLIASDAIGLGLNFNIRWGGMSYHCCPTASD